MFKFDFQIEEDEDDHLNIASGSTATAQAGPSTTPSTLKEEGNTDCHHISLEELVNSLPEEISYSPINFPFSSKSLLRRDLFDARFQLYNRPDPSSSTDSQNQKANNQEEGEEYVDAQTDLIPGLYEGGLKSWEGGVDLVEVINSIGDDQKVAEWASGSRILEVGCGTALPTLYILRSIFASSLNSNKTILHMQDYNSLVLSLVTLPNLILTALPFLPTEALHVPTEEEDLEDVLPDLENAGQFIITPILINAFKQLLKEKNIELKFTFGDWRGLANDLKIQNEGYDLVLTAETIYAEDNNSSLLGVLKEAINKRSSQDEKQIHKETINLEDSLGDLKVDDEWKNPLSERGNGFVLVAAKVLYFGVGGGLTAFLNRVEENKGWWKDVKEWTKGVGRKVVQVGW
ncbi:uncharacterized protein I206_102806 [Kwoniella pini CBS 10737]|uniref:protein-histidine N-methyltransferase n=1 Tax=Kwoniella pini CBS 10737 TaxID=1296096 RepID=A0A1B9I6E6_9TREE|nr:uncharacterized protein I206_03160 [Kwoniella pini CBS 10737]OCF51094.1 hypothetical protein I206_03160 [Kwoniella pini CBS 10737]